jgi:hypothetical protein
MNSWELTVEKNKKNIIAKSGQVQDDKFKQLVRLDPAGVPTARVSVGVSESLEYGSLKVSATVTLECTQDEATINQAGEFAFHKAVEFVKDGFSNYGVFLEEQRGKR